MQIKPRHQAWVQAPLPFQTSHQHCCCFHLIVLWILEKPSMWPQSTPICYMCIPCPCFERTPSHTQACHLSSDLCFWLFSVSGKHQRRQRRTVRSILEASHLILWGGRYLQVHPKFNRAAGDSKSSLLYNVSEHSQKTSILVRLRAFPRAFSATQSRPVLNNLPYFASLWASKRLSGQRSHGCSPWVVPRLFRTTQAMWINQTKQKKAKPYQNPVMKTHLPF